MRQEFFTTIDTIEIERPRKWKASSTNSGINIALDGIIDADTFPISCHVSSVSEMPSCHIPRGCTPFHNPITFEDGDIKTGLPVYAV